MSILSTSHDRNLNACSCHFFSLPRTKRKLLLRTFTTEISLHWKGIPKSVLWVCIWWGCHWSAWKLVNNKKGFSAPPVGLFLPEALEGAGCKQLLINTDGSSHTSPTMSGLRSSSSICLTTVQSQICSSCCNFPHSIAHWKRKVAMVANPCKSTSALHTHFH